MKSALADSTDTSRFAPPRFRFSISPAPVGRSLLFLCFQLRLQVGERIVGGQRSLSTGRSRPGRLIEDACMLVFMAIDAEQFPVASIQRIVVVVMVLVVHRQFPQ